MSNENKKVLVTGADGFIDSFSRTRFVEGFSVKALAQYNPSIVGLVKDVNCKEDMKLLLVIFVTHISAMKFVKILISFSLPH